MFSILSKPTSFLRRHVFILLVILLSLPAIKDLLLPGYFPMHDDFQVMRQMGMHQCILDLQIPCRWIPDAGFGFGYPMFNYYPPLPYYFGEVFVFFGVDLFWTSKLLFLLSIVLSGLFMFQLAKKFLGNIGGLIAAMFYLYAPYHSVDVYVRGALNEAWGLVWFPLIFLFAYNLVVKPRPSDKRNLALSYAALLLSHNVMTLIFTPLLGLWVFFWIFVTKNFKALKTLIVSGLWAIGLAAFFFIPVLFETRLVHVETMTVGYFNYLAHFADLNQMFITRFWGYGASTWGPEDEMAFPIGHLHWGVSFAAAAIAFLIVGLALLRRRKIRPLYLLPLIFTPAALFYVFLIHSRSTWFWDNLPVLYFAQFPWRLLAIPAFLFSLLAATIVLFIPKKFRLLTLLLVPAVIFWNLNFFKIQRQIFVTQQEKFSGRPWELQTTGGIFDYLPKTATRPPGDPAPIIPIFLEGQGAILNFEKGSNWLSFTAQVSSPSATLQLPLFNFPRWQITANGETLPYTHETDIGRLQLTLPQGEHQVKARLRNTPIRTISNLISLFSILLVLWYSKRKLTK